MYRVWTDVDYLNINDKGLEVQAPDKRKFNIDGRNIVTTQDWEANNPVIDQFKSLVAETHIIGSCKDPGLIAKRSL